MTNQEMVDKIVNKSGITREQAEQALEMNNGDLLDTMIYVEKTYMNNNTSSSTYSTNNEPQFNGQPAPDFNFSEQKNNTCVNGNNAAETGKRFVNLLTENGAAIFYNEKQVAVIPLVIWLIALVSGAGTLLVVMLVSMFFGIRYELTGNRLANTSLNKVLNDVYVYVQRLVKGNA